MEKSIPAERRQRMRIDVEQLLGNKVSAAEGIAGQVWPQIRDYVTVELRNLADMLIQIEALNVPEDEARLLMKLHSRTTEIVLASIEGMTLIAAESIVNVLQGAANTALGFDIFPTT